MKSVRQPLFMEWTGVDEMKKGQIVEGIIREVDYPNTGILELSEQAEDGALRIMVKDTVPGQRVRSMITKKRKNRCEARVLEVLGRAPQEVEPDCPHYGRCGGCSFRTLTPADQLRLKEDEIGRLFSGTAASDSAAAFSGNSAALSAASKSVISAGAGDAADRSPLWPAWYEGIYESPKTEGYRNKMEFTFGDESRGGELTLGMHCKGSFYDVVTVGECRIVDEDFRQILLCTLDWAKETGLEHYHRMRHTGYFRHLLVRKADRTGEILVDLVTTSEAALDLSVWVERLRKLPLRGTFAGILHTTNDSAADAIINQGTEVLWGRDYFYEEMLGLRFRITPFSFFQTNTGGAEILYEKVREYIGDTKDREIFDLYSGTGTIAQVLAPVAKHVTGVELVPEAVEAAKANAAENGLNNCTFIAGDVLKVLDNLTEKPELIVLDPPREGIHPKALPKILTYGVPRIVYVSCKATSLLRDLPFFEHAGYRVEKGCSVDLFPGTSHVETVVLMQRV